MKSLALLRFPVIPEGLGTIVVPLFFLHLHECGRVTKDVEGFEFDSADEARAEAVRAARDIMCGTLHDGALCLGCHIEVVDARDGSSFVVPFRDAVHLSAP